MIFKLKGIVDSINETYIIVDVGGVGYGVFIPLSMLTKMKVGSTVTLYIETIVREDSITLYGFENSETQNLFKLLMTVQGIGAKAAISILSSLSNIDINNAIFAGDPKPFTVANGIGKKTAERITSELKGKINKLNISSQLQNVSRELVGDMVAEDTISALSNLGYARALTYPIIIKLIAENPMIATPELIKLTLKKLNNL